MNYTGFLVSGYSVTIVVLGLLWYAGYYECKMKNHKTAQKIDLRAVENWWRLFR